MKRLVILGGSDAGISAALRARELDESVAVTVIVEDAFPNYSICGLPFYLSGEVRDYHQLAHRTREELAQAGIELLLDHAARAIDPVEHRVTVENGAAHLSQIPYDRLIIATGRLLGAQMAGPVQAEVAKRVDILATALYHEMMVEALSDLDLSYTPPLGSPWDLVQLCAQDWSTLARRGQAHISEKEDAQ